MLLPILVVVVGMAVVLVIVLNAVMVVLVIPIGDGVNLIVDCGLQYLPLILLKFSNSSAFRVSLFARIIL